MPTQQFPGIRLKQPRPGETPDGRNHEIGDSLITRNGMSKGNTIAIGSPIRWGGFIKSDDCNSQVSAVVAGGKLITRPYIPPQLFDIIGLWRMEEASGAILDSSGNENDGIYNGVLYQQAGRVNYSLGFDGTNDFVNVAYDSGFNVSALTISFWYYINAWTGNEGGHTTFFDRYRLAGGGASEGYYVGRRGDTKGDNKMVFVVRVGSTIYDILSDSDITETGVWHHVACTWDGSTTKMYLDKVLQADTAETASGLISSTENVELGRAKSEDEYLNGRLDETIIWKVALSARDIGKLP